MLLIVILRDNVPYYFINMFTYNNNNKKKINIANCRVFIILINNCIISIILSCAQIFSECITIGFCV